MDTGVRDLEVAFFKANSTWFNDIWSKNLSNRLIYAVLNIHNLGMILQLKDMPTVMNPVRIASSDGKPKNTMVCDTRYLQNEFGDLQFFLRF